MENVIHFFQVSGWTMWGIAACSVLALAVFVEKVWSLRRGSVIPRGLPERIERMVRENRIPEAISLCREDDASLNRVIEAGLENAGKSREQIKEIVLEVGEREINELEKYMNILNTAIYVAPMLGFLGTVLGMSQLFSSVAAAGEVTNVGMIAGGIYKALYTTIAGITVSIPATIFYRYLTSKTDRLVLEMEKISLKIVDLIKGA
ncbi:MotA/TolQ/ExbB proton channel family protein [Deltaproteobacteria bacterium PRO3]|nr:MotA/TolQ/ExbB proton channel family protein [Deltaproteobacteria bacterium PRO3]